MGDRLPMLGEVSLLAPVAAVAIVSAAAWFAWCWERKRREALAAVARELGLAFEPDRDRTRLGGRFDHIDLLKQGSNRYTQNHLVGRFTGHPVVACDYHYQTGSGKNTHHHHYGLVLVRVPLTMPEVRIRQESFFDRMAAAVGFEDIDFESAEFSKRYHVAGADRRFAYDLIHARAIEYLIEHGDYCWEFEGDTIAVYESGRFKPERIRPALDAAAGFVRLIPEFVWRDRGTGAGKGEHES